MSDITLLFREFAGLERKRRHGLSPAELERWMFLKRRLAREFSPEVSDAQADRRESVRVPTRLAVSFHDVGELRRCWMTNLSRGGVFVATEEILPIGTRLDLQIAVGPEGGELEVPVEVVSHNIGPDFRTRCGMGMRFLDLSPEVTKRLDELYESAFHRAVRKQ